MSSGLTPAQQSTLQNFREVAQIEDEYLCIEILQQNNWNLEMSLNTFVGSSDSSEPSSPQEMSGSGGARASSGGQNMRPTSTSSTSSASVNENQSNNNNSNNNNNNNNNNATVGLRSGNSVVDLLLTPLRWLIRPVNHTPNPALDTQNFISEFDRQYSPSHPTFHPNSYMNAVTNAFHGSRFLLVYLHASLHEDTENFCSNVICSESLRNFTEEHQITTWVGKIWDLEAYGLSIQLETSKYPFVALLVCQSERLVEAAERVQGFVEVGELTAKLTNGLARFGPAIERGRYEQNRRTEATRLREEQDMQYREAAEMDRLTRIQQEEEERRVEEEREEERRLAGVEEERMQARDTHIQSLRLELQSNPEPPPGPDIALVRFQLPTGKKLTRNFHRANTAQNIFDFLTVHFADDGNPGARIGVSTNYPKVDIQDGTKSLEDLGLYPRGMLYVNDLDA